MSWYKLFDFCMIISQISWAIISACLAITFIGGVILGWGR